MKTRNTTACCCTNGCSNARASGVHGGSAFRAIAGFGRHGVLSEQHFFELAGELTVVVEFLVSAAEADALLDLVHAEGTPLFHARFPVEFGIVEGRANS